MNDAPLPSPTINFTCFDCPRRQQPPSQLDLDIDHARATWRGRDLDLTMGEMRVLKVLVDAHGNYRSYRALYDVVQRPGFLAGTSTNRNGVNNGYHTNVRSCIKRIRRKFQAIEPGFDAIKNYVGFGYGWRE